MRIVFAASELSPLAHTGGLGDVLEGLPAALAARGHDVSICLPCYRGLRESAALPVRPTGVQIQVPIGDRRVPAEILECTAPNGVQLFLIRNDDFFDREAIYGVDGRAYDDNAARFIFFSKAVVELARRIKPAPEIIHAHDWQAALIPVLIKERRLPFRSVLTIHDIAYQGNFWAPDFGLLNLPGDYFTARGVEFFGQVNLLKGSLLFADCVTTVSQRYAQEIQTQEAGAGLAAVVREQAFKLHGIQNGLNERLWNPASDRQLPATFSAGSLEGKRACRDALLVELNLAPRPTGPVLTMVARGSAKKGIELLGPLFDRLLAHDVRLIIFGEGDAPSNRDLAIASRRHRERLTYRPATDQPLSHLVYAGSDLFLIPSYIDPGGANTMLAPKYGAVPIARAVTGLSESLRDDDTTTDTGNAILFHSDSPDALWDAIGRALTIFADVPHWARLQQRAMTGDVSWQRAAERYEAVYQHALRSRS